MPTFRIDETSEVEYQATAYTLMVYEQEFGTDLIQDVYGRIDITKAAQADDGSIVLDYTVDNWTAELRCFWAMCKTAHDIAQAQGRKIPDVPPYKVWIMAMPPTVDMPAISSAVFEETQRGFFPPKTEEKEQATK